MQSIIYACKKLYARGLVANHDGNITFKNTDGTFIATPTSFSKGDVEASDLLVINNEGRVVAGKHKVFSEVAIHLAIYKVRPDINCVVHAHPPTASGFALCGKDIGTPAIPEAIVSLGRGIFNAKNASDEELRRVLGQSDGFQIPGNGAWSVGQEVMQTYYRMELIEHIAQQHFVAEQMGELKRPASEVIENLLLKRPKVISNLTYEQNKIRSLVEEEVLAIYSREQ